jgi:capsular polysaccharide biosynthesis protein
MKIIYEEHLSKRKQPANLKNDDITLFQHEFEKKVINTHLLKLSNGIILKDLIIELWQTPHKYKSYSLAHPKITKKSIIQRFLFFRRGLKKINKGVWIIDDLSTMYFHWLTDAITRLEASNSEGEIYPIILPNQYRQFSFIEESLKLLGKQTSYYNTLIPLKVKKLLITSHTAQTGNYNRILINEVRNKFLKNFTLKGDKKVYISRLKAQKRKITNEQEVVTLLKSFGFEIHYFEDYSFEKQIELMSQTINLIGLHGAGLTNMLFMREGGKVLELRNQNDAHNNCYFSLASELNLVYFYQLNQGNTNDTHAVDITVDIDELRDNIVKFI